MNHSEILEAIGKSSVFTPKQEQRLLDIINAVEKSKWDFSKLNSDSGGDPFDGVVDPDESALIFIQEYDCLRHFQNKNLIESLLEINGGGESLHRIMEDSFRGITKEIEFQHKMGCPENTPMDLEQFDSITDKTRREFSINKYKDEFTNPWIDTLVFANDMAVLFSNITNQLNGIEDKYSYPISRWSKSFTISMGEEILLRIEEKDYDENLKVNKLFSTLMPSRKGKYIRREVEKYL